jgi:hypothetical protein
MTARARARVDADAYPKPTLLSRVEPKNGARGEYGLFKCGFCGNEFTANIRAIDSGNTKSCGCLKRGPKPRHGHAKRNQPLSPTYKSWANMINAGREKHVDERWWKFDNFLKDMGERITGQRLIRKDQEKKYSKWNCFWGA